jgi:hypothetical protein
VRTTTLDDGFEDWAGLRVNLRQLARCLADLHGAPEGVANGGNGPMSKDERNRLFDLALEHVSRHGIATSPPYDVPRCLFHEGRCKAVGAAQVALALLWAPKDECAAQPASDLHEAILKADAALAKLQVESEKYTATRAVRHDPKHLCTRQSHETSCLPIMRLSAELGQWRQALMLVDHHALLPQIPEHKRGPDRQGLLKDIEGTLYASGWTPDEILEIIDDGHPGKQTPRRRKDRLRHRLTHAHASRSP